LLCQPPSHFRDLHPIQFHRLIHTNLLITRLRRALSAPTKRLEQSKQQLAAMQAELETVQASGEGFEHQERFAFLKRRAKELEESLESLSE
jgi:hypothetical protein